MKRYIIFIFLVFFSIALKAQDFSDYNYSQFAIGGGFSYIRGYTNLNEQANHLAANVNLTYYLSPYIPVAAELQAGRLSGGSIVTDPYQRAYTNNYAALMVHADIQLGQLINYRYSDFLDALRGFYIGSGVGYIDDNNKVQRTAISDPSYVFPGTDHSIDLMVPLRFGYEFKFFDSFDLPAFRITISYEHNLVFGEGLDGYDDPSSRFKNNNIDQYRQISIGFKYDFGSRTSFTKLQ